MTPEERAKMLKHFVCTHYRPGIGAVIGPTSGEFFCEVCVAHEIRVAECRAADEALERAARWVETAGTEHTARVFVRDVIASGIRAHKSTREGK